MKLYLISQEANQACDTYDSAVVCAASKKDALHTHPDENRSEWDGKSARWGEWVDAEDVKVVEIGLARPKQKTGVICASYNAG